MRRTQTQLSTRVVAFLLSLVLIGSCFPAVFADEPDTSPTETPPATEQLQSQPSVPPESTTESNLDENLVPEGPTAPEVKVVRVTDSWAAAAELAVEASGASISTVAVRLNDGEASEVSADEDGNFVFNATENGAYLFVVTDSDGNVYEIAHTEEMIDAGSPEILDLSRVEEGTVPQATYVFTASDAVSGIASVTVDIDGNSTSLELTDDNSYSFAVSANAKVSVTVHDAAGNAVSASVEETNIAEASPSNTPAQETSPAPPAQDPSEPEDTEAPTIQATRHTDSWTPYADYTISVQDNVDVSSVIIRYEDQERELLEPQEDGSYLFTVHSNGSYTCTATDTSGNVAEYTVEESRIDVTAPSISDFQRESYEVEEGVYLVAIYSFAAADDFSGVASVTATMGDTSTALDLNSETGRYEFYAEANGSIRFQISDAAGNVTIQEAEEIGITASDDAIAPFASTGSLSSTYANSKLIDSLAYMGMDIQYLKDNNLFFNIYNFTGAGSSFFNVSAQVPGWRWSTQEGTTGLFPNTIKPSIAYNTRAYDHQTGPQAMGTETTAAGLPDLATIKSRGMVCLGYPNYYYFNYLPNVVKSETVSGGKIDYKAATDSLRSYFNTYTYTLTGLTMQNCPGTIELWREALDEAASDYTNPYLKVTKWTSLGNSALNKEAVYDQLTPGDIVIHSGNAGNGYGDNAHIGMYAGSRTVVKNWYLAGGGTAYEEHFFVDMTPDGIGLYSLSYLAGSSSKTGGPNTWYHIEFKVQKETHKDGAIEVYKKDPNGANLAGAKFTATHTDGTVRVIGPTDNNGYAKVSGLPYGTYTVKETVFPTGYTSSGQTEWTVTVGAEVKTATINAENKKITGICKIVKETTNSGSKEGWHFTVKNSGGTVIGNYVTDSSGVININLEPGTYTVIETDGVYQYWANDPNPTRTVTIKANETARVTFKNQYKGKISIQKVTNTGKNLNGWIFDIKDANGNIVATLTTDANGKATSGLLEPGNYNVVERSAPNGYWVAVTGSAAVKVEAGKTAPTTFTNNHYGQIVIKKSTNTGTELSGWIFDIKNASGQIVQTLTTDGNGNATSQLLVPGNYTVTERSTNNTFWASVEPNKTATVTGGQNTVLMFENNKRGQIQVTKTTNTGNNKDNWTFLVKDSSGNLVDTLVTNENGYDLSIMLMPGTYTVTEVGSDDHYWSCDVSDKVVTVTAGEISSVTASNCHRGRAKIIKQTNTGADLEGWIFGIYADNACTNKVAELTSGASGETGLVYLEPGVYYWTEIGHNGGLFDSEYWPSNAEVREITIVEGQDTVVEHTNVHYGKISIVKTMDTDGPLDGWVFHIYDANGAEVDGSPFTTDENGNITTGVLLPGTYTVKEDLPDNNLYYCKSENPQTVTVVQGQTASVSFTNALRPGKIQITKVNFQNEKLADAKFALEWSDDNGATWNLIQFSDKEDVVKGGCTSPNLVDGTLVTDASGVITFENLYPTLLYRVTEVEAPSGYMLLTEAAYEDVLPVEDLTAELTVHNGRSVIFPATGVNDMAFDAASIGTTMLTVGLILTMMLMVTTVPNGTTTEENKIHKEERNNKT